jgi:hypothetical protein
LKKELVELSTALSVIAIIFSDVILEGKKTGHRTFR